MNRDELIAARTAFEEALTSSAGLPIDARLDAALTAAFDALTPNRLAEERARKIIAAIALKHDTTSADVRGSCRLANTVIAREEAADALVRAGFSHREVARLLGRSSASIVRVWVASHEARVRAAGTERREASAHG